MLSDAARPWTALACVVGLVVCMGRWAWLHEHGDGPYASLQAHPAAHDGTDVVFSLARVAAIDGPDRFAVEKGTLRFEVDGSSDGLALGDDVSLGGVWRAEGPRVELAWLENRRAGRQAKRALGAVGLGLGLGLWLLAVRREGWAWGLRG